MEVRVFNHRTFGFETISIEELNEYAKREDCIVRVINFFDSKYPVDIPSALYVAIDEVKN